MARIPLTSGAYTARSLIADAQSCENLFPEVNPGETNPPAPVTHYLTPGLVQVADPAAPSFAAGRCIYRDTQDIIYCVIGNSVYWLDANFTPTFMGLITNGTTPVSISDNGVVAVLVDGTGNGYWWNINLRVFNQIVDPNFFGADRVCFLDGYFVFNLMLTNEFYLSPYFYTGAEAFDPLYIASKTGGADRIISIGVIRGELWLVGALTTEVWYNAGGADFPFARQPGVFIDHGMLRGYTIAENDVELFWLGRDRQGRCIVFMGREYQAIRVSDHAMENEVQSYAVVSDAIGFCYQQGGHTFYQLTFPTANRTWVYDLSTKQWHRRTWNGTDRHRANGYAFGNNECLIIDWETGRISRWDLDAYTDNGVAITRRRGFPHLLNDGKRVSYSRFIADMEVSAAAAAAGAQLYLRWSDTRGATWGTPIAISMGGAPAAGYRSLLWPRLGIARDRVFELYWDFPYATALQGAFIETEGAET